MGTETNYSIIPLPTSDAKSENNHELYDLEKIAVRDVPYAEQEGFYVGAGSSHDDVSTSSSSEW
jgi:hypothetical protein